MRTKLNKQNRGFTIIEVMIVLGIAGLILAIVLLAVPALQRSQRNNARRADAVHYGGLASDYISNHGGTPPTAGSATCTATPPTGTLCTNGETFSQLKTFTVTNGTSTTGASLTNAVINTNATCDPTTNGLTGQNGSFAVSFGVEAPAAPALTGNIICLPS